MPRRIIAIASLLLCLFALPAAAEIPDVFTGARRIVAVGDIHGDYDKLVAVLSRTGLVNQRGDWTGGKAHLVQTGDVVDRGPDSRKCMDLLRHLEQQAAAAGGGVHALIGNHEAMNILGDLRYVSDEELAAFGDPPRGTPVGREPMGSFPGHRAAFSPTGPYGKWILGHNVIVKVNGTLFMHGGLSPKYAGWDVRRINDAIRKELASGQDPHTGVVGDPEGPLWYRGLAEPMQEQILRGRLDQIFTAQKAVRIVLGHTVQERGISLWLDGRLVLIDVGMSRRMLNAPAAALVIVPAGAGKPDQLSVVSQADAPPPAAGVAAP